MSVPVRLLPSEVQLAIDLQPCLAERRTYERTDRAHPCEFFAGQGSFHSFDLDAPGPPPSPGVLHPVHYAGRRRIVPELLSGCRKAPIMAVGINPNLPAFWPRKHDSLLPVFCDVLQYAHHFRYRAIGKLRVQREQYRALLDGRADQPNGGPDLTEPGTKLEVELANQRMYQAYQSLLDGLAEDQGWDAQLRVSEDLSYGNMVGCGSPRWITKPDSKLPSLPYMSEEQQEGIVLECFFERRHFLRQLFQSLPSVLLVFGAATRDAVIGVLDGRFVQGDPRVGESAKYLIERKIVLEYGHVGDQALRARVLFVPHASGNPGGFAALRAKVVAALSEEVEAGTLDLDPATGHLRRAHGACSFCDNALYRIGNCGYAAGLQPLAAPLEESAEHGAPAPGGAVLRENQLQQHLLTGFLNSEVQQQVEEAGEEATTLMLKGRVVTMDVEHRVIDRGVVYVRGSRIVAVRAEDEPPPEGFDQARELETAGTIFPGLLDLHNHVAYNVLPPWPVGKRYDDRSQWRRARDYARRVRIMRVLKTGDPALAVARWVEVKALLGGVTTMQGMRSSFASVSSAMRGLVRNVETRGPDMPRAGSSVSDLDVRDDKAVERFHNAVNHRKSAFFYHLSEGINAAARKHWDNLVSNDLLGPGLVGIHALALGPADFGTLDSKDSSVVWSPTSNLMLYGSTLPVQALLSSGVRWTLGCDWSPSGGKNPLFELKIARAVARSQGVEIEPRELVAAVTSRAAETVRWDAAVGRLEEGLRADLLVLEGASADPYEQLLAAVEADVQLVMIDGLPRAGTRALFDAAGVPAQGRERVLIGGREQLLWLRDPGMPLDGFELERARRILTERMGDPNAFLEESAEEGAFELVLDDHMEPLPPLDGVEEADEDGSFIIEQQPDALVVQGDTTLWEALAEIEHFPQELIPALQDLYR
jgi:cytosine/adenosine deaminase-related metal-dependent hydrolase